MKIADQEFETNYEVIFKVFNGSNGNGNHEEEKKAEENGQQKHIGKYLQVKECLEYIKQASTNPSFGNDFMFEFKEEQKQPEIQDPQDSS